ncbi:MAG TPA: RNA polymerase sigma factor region1.1 domain-containing protein, partial [Steroidobacteraceae bacterium]
MKAASEKTVVAVAGVRDKDRGKHPATVARKTAAALSARASVPHPRMNDVARAPDGKLPGVKLNADKRPLGLERRVPVMPEDRQSQLKLLIARGKEQGYLTYAQVNDHLPSE